MKRDIECDCQSCGAQFLITYDLIPNPDIDPVEQDEVEDELEPTYCCFCGGRLDGYDEPVDA